MNSRPINDCYVFQGAVYKCRFRMTKVRDVKQLMSTANSVVTYDYFDIMFKQFTEETLQNSRTVVGRNQGFEVDPTVRYSSFFRAAALNLMENCAAKLKETSISHQKELHTLVEKQFMLVRIFQKNPILVKSGPFLLIPHRFNPPI